MKKLLLVSLFLFPAAASAQNSGTIQPLATIEVPKEPTIVGQPAIVRLRVLVPTFMPSPPVFPSLEQENLLVRLPDRASGPISQTVEGETWSGVQRSYRLYPLAEKDFDFGEAQVLVTFADPETNEPVQVSVPLPEVKLAATIPDGASGLEPLIIARGFELQQEIEAAEELTVGDAITRRVTATIVGTSPIMIPSILTPSDSPNLRAYPKEPRLTETEDRGILSGSRTEQIVYVAQGGGNAELSDISLDWFNLETGTVETATISPVTFSVAAPPLKPPEPETLVRFGIALGLAAVLSWLVGRKLIPVAKSWCQTRLTRYKASPGYAFLRLKRAVRQRNLSGCYAALEQWSQRTSLPPEKDALERALTEIGALRFSGRPLGEKEDWTAVRKSLSQLRRAPPNRRSPLPPLNPYHPDRAPNR